MDVTWEVVDEATVRNLARWKIAVGITGDVIIWAARVDLTAEEQERFAQAYVDACLVGKVKRGELRKASGMNAVERAARDLIGIPDIL
jgi:hypothetical protein